MPFDKNRGGDAWAFRSAGRAGWRVAILAVLLLAGMTGGMAAQMDGSAMGACPPSRPRPLVLEATRAALARGGPFMIVALGSSSTEGVGASRPDRAYPARLQALLREAWGREDVTVLNRGIGGQTDDLMLARIDADVLAEHPVLVIWQVGANAVLRRLDPGRFAASLDEGVRRIVASGADLVVMDNQVAPRLTAMPDNAVYGEIIGRLVPAWHVSLFSRTALMRDWAEAEPLANDMIGEDGIHHTDRGYECLAAALAWAIARAVEGTGKP